ncbi:unnamed protein product [Oreochromis niloticus]|nr:unnamed protein product [Mustela putorius furo]
MAESPSIHSDVIEKNIKLRQQVREFKGENENLRKNIEVLLKEYGFSKNKRKRELQLENEKLCLENLDLNYCVAYLHCENQALRQQVQAKESAYELNDQELKSALEQLKSNLKMPSKHKEFDMEKLALQEKVEDLQTDNQAFRAENDDIIRNMCELKENFQKEKNKMRQQIQALQNDIREANATLETFKGFKEMYEQLKQENESLNNQNQDLKQEIETKNIAVQEEIQELKSVLQGLKSVENDSNRIRQQNNALEQEVQELTKKLADCQKEMRQNEEALQEKMQVPDKGEPHQSSFELTPNSNESTEKEERIKTSENTDLEEKNKDIPTESSSHMETPQEQTFKPRDVEERISGDG